MNSPDEITGSKASISGDLFDVGDRVAMSWGSSGATVFLVLSRTKDRLLVRSSNGLLLIMDDEEIENRSAVRMPPKKPPFWRRLFTSNETSPSVGATGK